MTDEIKLPPLPEWSKMDDLNGFVPSEIRQHLTEYALAAIEADRKRTDNLISAYQEKVRAPEADNEQTSFESWYGPDSTTDVTLGRGEWSEGKRAAWEAWQARATLQSQDLEDAERYRAWRKAVASQNGNFLRLVSNELPDWDEGSVDESRIDEAIDHARRVEGDWE